MKSKQKALKILKENLKLALRDIDIDGSRHKSPNHLMSIGISSDPGVLIYYYGKDPVKQEVTRLSKTKSEEDKLKDKRILKIDLGTITDLTPIIQLLRNPKFKLESVSVNGKKLKRKTECVNSNKLNKQ